jgi:hypothetical protein
MTRPASSAGVDPPDGGQLASCPGVHPDRAMLHPESRAEHSAPDPADGKREMSTRAWMQRFGRPRGERTLGRLMLGA